MNRRAAALLICLALSGCGAGGAPGSSLERFLARLFGRPTPPSPVLRYIVGEPYEAGGSWRYPRVDFTSEQTGLAAIAPAHAITADGEAYDPIAMAAGHATLQLPALVRVTNLENGRSLMLRLNDRGPASPGRLLDLTPRAAQLLGAQDGTQLRLVVQESESRQLATSLNANGPALDVATAPAGTIRSETLEPPGGGSTSPGRAAPNQPGPAAAPVAVEPAVPARLPEQLIQLAPQPGRLFIAVGAFSQPSYARLLASRLATLGAEVVADTTAPRERAYLVRLGPFANPAAADAALDHARHAGVTDADIIVQP